MKNEPEKKLSVVFEFSESGYLRSILLNAPNESAQKTLEAAMNRLFKPNHFAWVRRLFR